MKQTLTLAALAALLCLAAPHALPAGFERFFALQEEAEKQMQGTAEEWAELQPTDQTLDQWREERMRKWGMHYLERYAELFNDPNEWYANQEAYFLWRRLDPIANTPEMRKALDDWRLKWLGDPIVGRKFYSEMRLHELAKQSPDIKDAAKIARTLMSEFPMRREPYRALLSIVRRNNGAEAHDAALAEILASADTPENIKAYLQMKPEDKKAAEAEESWGRWIKAETDHADFDYYEIRESQLWAPYYEMMDEEDANSFLQNLWLWLKRGLRGEGWGVMEWDDMEKRVALQLIVEFPDQISPYYKLKNLASKAEMVQEGENRFRYETDFRKARAWTEELLKGPAPGHVKTYFQESLWSDFQRAFREHGKSATYRDEFSGGMRAWREQHAPKWRMLLEVYDDYVEDRLQGPEDMRKDTPTRNEDGTDGGVYNFFKRDAIWLLNAVSRINTDPAYWPHLMKLNARWLARPDWTEEERMQLRGIRLFMQEAAAGAQLALSSPRDLSWFKIDNYPPDVCEKVARALQKEFPNQQAPYSALLNAAELREPWDRALFQEILDSPAASQYDKKRAHELMDLLDRVGQPFELKGIAIALEGRDFIAQPAKGKVALIHFWATWDQASLAGAPRIRELYGAFHAQGLEVISISADNTPAQAEAFLAQSPLPWHHYWDKSWTGVLQTYTYTSTPALWLIDKKGIIRDVNASRDLEKKIKTLVAEPL